MPFAGQVYLRPISISPSSTSHGIQPRIRQEIIEFFTTFFSFFNFFFQFCYSFLPFLLSGPGQDIRGVPRSRGVQADGQAEKETGYWRSARQMVQREEETTEHVYTSCNSLSIFMLKQELKEGDIKEPKLCLAFCMRALSLLR